MNHECIYARINVVFVTQLVLSLSGALQTERQFQRRLVALIHEKCVEKVFLKF